MNGQEIIRAVIDGQRNIDRMKSEINIIFSTLSGLGKMLEVKTSEEVFVYDVYEWYVDLCGQHTGQAQATCKKRGVAVYRSTGAQRYYSTIEDAYDALPVLVMGILEKYPQLKDAILPLERAANKQF